jgi:hypothetical protein
VKFAFGISLLVLVALYAIGCNKADRSSTANPAPSPATPVGVGAQPASPPPTAATSDEDAIRAAIERHLRENSGINLAAMDTTFDSISIQGDKAQANVTFRLKQGGTSMTMTYMLSRQANGWLVLHSQPGGGQFPHPPLDKNHSGIAENPQAPGTPDLKRFFKHDSTANPAGSHGTASSPEK